MNERVKTNLRSAIYEMGGIYLLYLAYQMFQNKEESSGGEYLAVIAAIVGFLVVGTGMIAFGFYMMNKVRKQDIQAREEAKAVEENKTED